MQKNSVIPASFHTQTAKMFVLSFSHFFADMMTSMLPGILPVLLVYFNLNLGLGVIMISAMLIGANLLQIPASLIGRHSRSPIFLALGLILAAVILFLPYLPSTTPLLCLYGLMFVVGAGNAMVHPAGLRGTQNLYSLPVGMVTAAFMTFGFLGGAVSPWLSAFLVNRMGLRGLIWLLIPGIFALASLTVAHIRLKPDRKEDSHAAGSELDSSAPWAFGSLFLIATLLNTGTVTFTSLLPTLLHDYEYPLWFGGFSNMLFGVGSSIGSIVLGIYSRKHKTDKIILGCMPIGILCGILYLCFAGHSAWYCLVILLIGLLLSAGYPILVSLTPAAPGRFSTSVRMGLIVGGTWGIAGVLLLGIGQIAARYGILSVMILALCIYFCAFLTAVFLRRKKQNIQTVQTMN